MSFLDLFSLRKRMVKSFSNYLKSNYLILDVRTKQEFEAGSIPEAVNIPFEVLYENLPQLNKDHNFILFCRTGNRSRHAKDLLNQHGFKSVLDVGGMENLKALISEIKLLKQ